MKVKLTDYSTGDGVTCVVRTALKNKGFSLLLNSEANIHIRIEAQKYFFKVRTPLDKYEKQSEYFSYPLPASLKAVTFSG